jgi:hypothetical protein
VSLGLEQPGKLVLLELLAVGDWRDGRSLGHLVWLTGVSSGRQGVVRRGISVDLRRIGLVAACGVLQTVVLCVIS